MTDCWKRKNESKPKKTIHNTTSSHRHHNHNKHQHYHHHHSCQRITNTPIIMYFTMKKVKKATPQRWARKWDGSRVLKRYWMKCRYLQEQPRKRFTICSTNDYLTAWDFTQEMFVWLTCIHIHNICMYVSVLNILKYNFWSLNMLTELSYSWMF